MTIKEIKNYIEKELKYQKDVAKEDETVLDDLFINWIKFGVLNSLWYDAKITNVQYQKLIKFYNL